MPLPLPWLSDSSIIVGVESAALASCDCNDEADIEGAGEVADGSKCVAINDESCAACGSS